MFEIKKYWPSDYSSLSVSQAENLVQIYRDSILQYAEKSKKSELEKSGKISQALIDINNYVNSDFMQELVLTLRTLYPRRTNLMKVLSYYKF